MEGIVFISNWSLVFSKSMTAYLFQEVILRINFTLIQILINNIFIHPIFSDKHLSGAPSGRSRRLTKIMRPKLQKQRHWSLQVELSQAHSAAGLVRSTTGWRTFERSFRAELKQPDKSHLLDALTALSHVTNFSIGCYCSNEKLCHRSILRAEFKKRGALIE